MGSVKNCQMRAKVWSNTKKERPGVILFGNEWASGVKNEGEPERWS